MTTNYQIENYFKKHPVRTFRGVYASNEINSLKLPQNSSIIVNYSPNTARGSHWIAMRHLNDKNHPPEYFDSYGYIPDYDDKILGVKTGFRQFLEDHNYSNSPVRYNDKDLQGYGSDVCGEYSTYFIKYGLPNYNPKPWKDILSLPTPEERDHKIRKEVAIRPYSRGFEGDGLARANAFWEYLNPQLLQIFAHDKYAPLTLYYALKHWVQSSTKRKIVEYQKFLHPYSIEALDWNKIPFDVAVAKLPKVKGNDGLLRGFLQEIKDNTINKQLKQDKDIILNTYNNLRQGRDKLKIMELFDDPHLDDVLYHHQLKESRK